MSAGGSYDHSRPLDASHCLESTFEVDSPLPIDRLDIYSLDLEV